MRTQQHLGGALLVGHAEQQVAVVVRVSKQAEARQKEEEGERARALEHGGRVERGAAAAGREWEAVEQEQVQVRQQQQ